MKTLIASILLCAAALCVPLDAAAAVAAPLKTQDQPLIPLLHARWLARDGAPPNIESIAQTPDGWLWLASSAGLYRFDGVQFSPYVPPPGVKMSTNIQELGTFPDGTLWVVPRFGDLYLIKGDQVRMFEQKDGFPGGSAWRVAAGHDGRLWMAIGMGLYVLEPAARQWRFVKDDMGLPSAAFDVLVDRAGTVWVHTSMGSYALRRGGSRFSGERRPTSPGSLVQGPDGVVWLLEGGKSGLRRLSPGTTPTALADMLGRMHQARRILIDREGNFWFPGDIGVTRVAVKDQHIRAEGFGPRQGMSGSDPLAAFQDREGNIWISTESGLDQFRPGRMREIVLPPYRSDARPLAVAPDGALWIDSSFLPDIHSPAQHYGPARARNTTVHQLYRDPLGTVWYGTYSRLWKLDGLKRVRVPLPHEVEILQDQEIYAMAADADGGLWISLGPRGPWRLKDDAWIQFGGIDALKISTTLIVAGPDRKLWFGSVGNRVVILQDGKASSVGPGEGLDVGTVVGILPDAGGAWIAGDEGLARFDGKRAVRIAGERGEQFLGGTGMLPKPDGGLWINSARGLVELAGADLRKALASPGHPVRHRIYDDNDGLPGGASPLYPNPSMVRTPDGQLVISTTGGVFHFDPARSVSNALPPPVHVTGIQAGEAPFPLRAGVKLPAAPGTVRIDYTATSLSLPRRVRFQYMLEGVDRDWQDAGARRNAFYTRLAPGAYTFRVKAANDDGIWNEEGASLRFEVPPTMSQTGWFKLACVLAALLAIYLLHRLRLRMALRRQSRLFETRVAERERIARDLHDTLLQSVQGLIMHFRRIALRTPGDAPTRPLMQEALAMATEVLEEGRDKVGGLRSPAAQADLAALLDAHGQRLAAQHPVRFSLHEDGAPRRLRAPVLDEVLAIGREAVRNAFLHAEAAFIEVTLRHGEREFELVVTDDGVGIDPSLHAGRAGHWGICGMRERAAELGAALELRSAPGEGATWRLRLPARLAYAEREDIPAPHEGELQ